MRASNCEQIDGYLGKWLAEEELVQFEAHLANCADCRQFVEEQQRLKSLLARANTECVPVPPALIGRINHRLRQAQRRRAAGWAISLAAAGVLICAFTGWFFVQRMPDDRSVQPPTMAKLPQPPQPARDSRPPVAVTFQPSSDVIAVPHKTDNPSVTIIWVYPTIKVDQESSPEPSDSFESPERNGI
jgi:Putative zinc-finger